MVRLPAVSPWPLVSHWEKWFFLTNLWTIGSVLIWGEGVIIMIDFKFHRKNPDWIDLTWHIYQPRSFSWTLFMWRYLLFEIWKEKIKKEENVQPWGFLGVLPFIFARSWKRNPGVPRYYVVVDRQDGLCVHPHPSLLSRARSECYFLTIYLFWSC